MNRLPVLVCLLLLSSGQPHAQARAQDREAVVPMVVTSDTDAYCQTLLARIRAHRTLPPAVRDLQQDGSRLCDEGLVRDGINRLRRALMVLRSGHTAPDPGRDDTPHD